MTQGSTDHDLGAAIEALRPLQGRWTLHVIAALLDGPAGFNDLRRAIPGIGPGPLIRTLDHLTQEGLAVREVLDTRPPSSRYLLSEAGYALRAAFEEMAAWTAAQHGAPGAEHSGIGFAIDHLFNRKWALEIHCALIDRARQFAELERLIHLNAVSLSQRLAELERLGLVHRVVVPGTTRAAYAHTDTGHGMHEVGMKLVRWAMARHDSH